MALRDIFGKLSNGLEIPIPGGIWLHPHPRSKQVVGFEFLLDSFFGCLPRRSWISVLTCSHLLQFSICIHLAGVLKRRNVIMFHLLVILSLSRPSTSCPMVVGIVTVIR